jgi:hypothetical protein
MSQQRTICPAYCDLPDSYGSDKGRFMSRTPDVLSAIDKANPIASRSKLGRWMRANHDALMERFAGQQMDWSALAKLFGEAGLTDRAGKPPSPDTARKAWQRARKAVEAARSKTHGKPAGKPPKPSDPEEGPKPEHVFEPGRFELKPVVMRGVPPKKSSEEGT